MDLENVTVTELSEGFRFEEEEGAFRCLLCGRSFPEGEVFPLGGRFYTAARAAELHVEQEHPDRLIQLMEEGRKYLTLTQKQAELLALFSQGESDSQIAAGLGVSPSTVRHQRFVLREKAKSAKLFLSLWELSKKKQKQKDGFIALHGGAKMVDDRYNITEEENQKILDGVFLSQSPLRLKVFSAKEKKKIVILRRIIQEFEIGKRYTEKEVNGILGEIYGDYATLRRYLVEYGYMDRTSDCREYWVRQP